MSVIIGITGKSGAGKTHLCRLLQRKGFLIESADELNRQLLSQETVLSDLEERLKTNIRLKNGLADKEKLFSLILTNPIKKKIIEECLHPQIYANLLKKTEKLDQNQWVFFEGALLCEGKQNDFLSASVLIQCPEEICRQRLLGGRKIPIWIVNALLAIQTPDQEKVKYVTHSFSGISSKKEKLTQLLENLKAHLLH